MNNMHLNDLNIIPKLLTKLKDARVGLIGDACLDIYWHADMKLSELSRETPHYPLPIIEERFSLGAAANVLANLCALNLKESIFISVCGHDWRKRILEELITALPQTQSYLIEADGFVTPGYCKPIRHGISEVFYEDPRLDFSNYHPLPKKSEDEVLDALDSMAKLVDVIAVSDQLPFGCITERVRERLCDLGKTKTIIVDSRDRAALYHSVIIKPNEIETARIVGFDLFQGNLNKNLQHSAEILYSKTKKPIIITLGEEGSFYFDEQESTLIPAQKVEPPIDFVGAGDSFLSGVTAAFAVNATGPQSLLLGNLASACVIKKIGVTGTASISEIQQECTNRKELFHGNSQS